MLTEFKPVKTLEGRSTRFQLFGDDVPVSLLAGGHKLLELFVFTLGPRALVDRRLEHVQPHDPERLSSSQIIAVNAL